MSEPSATLTEQELQVVDHSVASNSVVLNSLTDELFFGRHPERERRKLSAGEPGFAGLRDEWNAIHRSVMFRARPIPLVIFDGFEVDSAKLTPEHRRLLGFVDIFVRELPTAARSIGLVGHADGTGAADHNRELAQRRADTVVAAIGQAIEARGLPAVRMRASSAGEDEPVRSNRTADDRARNRRVEVFAEPESAPSTANEPSVPPSFEEVVRRALDLLARQDEIGERVGVEPTKRLVCVLQKMLDDPQIDDRIVGFNSLWGQANFMGKGAPWEMILSHYKQIDRFTLRHAEDAAVLRSLAWKDEQVHKGIAWLAMQRDNLDVALSPGFLEVNNWVAQQQRNPHSVYSCYR